MPDRRAQDRFLTTNWVSAGSVVCATVLLACCGRPSSGAFALLSPRVGDTLLEGRSYVIRWSAPVGMRISLGLVMGGKDRGMLLVDAPAQPDSLVWKVPVGFVTGYGIASSDQVRLRLEQADSAERYVEAGPFTVAGGQ